MSEGRVRILFVDVRGGGATKIELRKKDRMTLHLIFWSLLAVVVLIVVPIAMVWSMVAHLRGRGSERPGSGGVSAGIGAAMQELDRIYARPSVEHQIEAENAVLKREDDAGGE
jgi:hypothetical protein